MNKLTDIRFVPITQVPFKGHCGFVDFFFEGKFLFKDIAVYQRLNKKGFRLVYPANKTSGREFVRPNNKEITKIIDEEITEFMEKRNYGQSSRD